MKRRNALQLIGSSAAFLTLPSYLMSREMNSKTTNSKHLFFSKEDIPRIRQNSKLPLFKNNFQEILKVDLKECATFVRENANTKDLVRAFALMQEMLRRQSLVYLVTQEKQRGKLVLDLIKAFINMPKWDYFQAGTETFGLQRAPGAAIYLLFAREALGNLIDKKLDEQILSSVAEKGCLPSYVALWGMDNKETVKNWHFDPEYLANYDIQMDRWPEILDGTNLKAVPAGGLGLGALALLGIDDRADYWLDMAVHSSKEWLQLLSKDGGYFEGISYADYSFRNLFLFFDAHQRIKGDVDWIDMANFYGFTEYLVCLQLGRQLEENRPDIVNFSDARNSFFPISACWIANNGNDSLAQYAAENFSGLFDFHDYLLYHPGQKTTPPPDKLKNKMLDLEWIICRTGWEENDNFIAFKSGMPANHEHADRNSFIFKAYGERLLTDQFGAAYDWRDVGWLLRLTEAHNTILIDGVGHHYVDGSEGTCSSLAEAKVHRFVDRGDFVWWNSEATQAYQVVNYDVKRVMRSVLFARPDVVVVFDQMEKKKSPSKLSARFFPDNRDEKAELATSGSDFSISRPNAKLFAKSFSNAEITVKKEKLDLPAEKGVFPFIEVETEKGKEFQLVTVLVARSKEKGKPDIKITPLENNWTIEIDNLKIMLENSGELPNFSWEV
jgi:hypothetical protein